MAFVEGMREMAKKKLSRDQKRKRKLQRRRSRVQTQPMAYYGDKYRSKKYVMALMRAEVGIYETYVMTERELTDRQVKSALRSLIQELRSGPYQPAERRKVIDIIPGQETQLLTWNIRRNWDILFASKPRHSNADLVGILRTILSSIEIWSTPSPDSRGYLNYLEGFLTEAGVEVAKLPMGEKDWEEEEAPSDEERLLDLGLGWLDTRAREDKRKFFVEAKAMLKRGQAETVINVCQHLIGHCNGEAMIRELYPLLQPAYHKLGVPFGLQLPWPFSRR